MNSAPAAALSAIVSFFALSRAVHVSFGAYSPEAIFWLGVGAVACVAAVFLPPGLASRPARRAVPWALAFGLLLSFATYFETPPTIFTRVDAEHSLTPLFGGLLAAACITGSFLTERFARARLLALVGSFFFLGCWVVWRSPDPMIDVYYWHRDGLRALLSGQNPYAITIPNIYEHTRYYGPGVVENGQVMYGYPYLPASLLLSIPGHIVGDYRYSLVAALAASGWFIGRTGQAPYAQACAAALLFSPKTLFVVEQGWTESYLVLLVSAAVYFAVTHRTISQFALSMTAAAKQYALVLVVFTNRLHAASSRRHFVKMLAISLAVAAAILVPFVAWGPDAFYRSVVELHLKQPFREDSLSFAAFFARHGLPRPHPLFSFALVGGLAFYTCFIQKHTRPALAMALCALGFFVFNKQAFANYYFLVMGLLAIGTAAIFRADVQRKTERPT